MSISRSSVRRPLAAAIAILATAVLASTAPAVAEPGEVSADGDAAAGHTATAQGLDGQLWAKATLRRMSLEEKVGQLFVTYAYGATADAASPKNRDEFGVDTPAEIVRKYHLGGVIYFAWTDSVHDPKQTAELSNGLQLAALSSGANVPLLISTDQEQGLVTRIGPPATQFPGSMALGAGRSTTDAEQAAAITGRELRAMGVNQDFAPDADVNLNPANPVIGVRSFSSDPTLVSQMVSAQVKGYQDTVSATVKHFPGHGDTATDSHTGLPVINHDPAQWEKVDAPPFRAAIASGVDTVMSAHIVVPRLDPSGEPATLSPAVLTGLLRQKLGYHGVVITDSLQMEGVRQKHSDAEIPVLALRAGVDQLLMPKQLDTAIRGVVDAVHNGTLTEQRIDESVLRVLTLKFKRGLPFHPLVSPGSLDRTVGTREHLAAAQRITDHTITAIRNDDGMLPLRTKPATALVTGWGDASTATLADRMSRRGTRVTPMPTGAAPTADSIDKAVAAAGQQDLVVVLTNDLAGQPQQRALVDALVATGRKVVAVAVRNPYDPAYAESAGSWLASYSYTGVAMESITKVIFGEVSPRGKLPVDVPNPSDPSTPRFPFGHGLTW